MTRAKPVSHSPAADRGARDDGLRACSKCGERKCWPASFANGRGAECKTCFALRMQAWRKAIASDARRSAQFRTKLREKQRAVRAAKRALRGERPERAVGPFDTTRIALERAWGAYATWTRDQHAQHSAILRRMAGIEDETPRAEVAA